MCCSVLEVASSLGTAVSKKRVESNPAEENRDGLVEVDRVSSLNVVDDPSSPAAPDSALVISHPPSMPVSLINMAPSYNLNMVRTFITHRSNALLGFCRD